MKNLSKLTMLAGLATAGIFAVPAQAQTLSQETTADRPFSGVYVGAAGGYDVQPNDVGSSILFDRNGDGNFNDSVNTITGANAFSPGFCNGSARTGSSAFGCRNDDDGWAYYGRAGIDAQRGNIVVGVVGEFGKTEITDSTSGFSTTPASYTMSRKIDWEASVRGRAGYAINTTLFYGTFGAGYAKIDNLFFTTNTANAFSASGSKNQWGFLGGGGIEQKLTKNISIGMEYMYHQYQDNDARVRVTAGTALAGSPVLLANNPFVLAPNTSGTTFRRSDDNFRWHSLRGTVNFRF
jgi:outer membrane immunogenic protein